MNTKIGRWAAWAVGAGWLLSGVAAPAWILNNGPDAVSVSVAQGATTCELGLFAIRPTGTDMTLTPSMKSSDAFAATAQPFFAVRYRMKTRQTVGGLFFTTDTLKGLSDKSYTPFPIVGDGTWRHAVVDMRTARAADVWKGTVTSFRFDPANPSEVDSKIEISRLGFFASADEAEAFLVAANDAPDYARETVLRVGKTRCRIPGGCLRPGWNRAQYLLASTTVPAGDGVPVVCRDGTPVPSYVSVRGWVDYIAEKPGTYTVARVAADQAVPMPGAFNTPTWDRRKFQIGAYCLNPAGVRTDAVVRDIKACGIDFIIGMDVGDVKTLDLFAKHGLAVFANGAFPGWWGGNGRNAGQMATCNSLAAYRVRADDFPDHPAIWAADIGDEPSALDFPHYGDVVANLRTWAPGLPLYLNLYPNYASVAENTGTQTTSQLGTPTYKAYIDEYCRHVPLDYISYDFYPYMKDARANDVFRLKMYDNFKIVADACRATGRSFWYIPQVNSRYEDQHMTENTLRFQAYAAMAFGAESIAWACYTKGWWVNNVINADGTKNVEYDRLRTVNAELRRLGEPFMRFRNVATHFIGFPATEKLDTIGVSVKNELDTGYVKGVRATDGAALLVGEMVSRDAATEARALFVMAADDMYDRCPTNHTIVFWTGFPHVRVTGGQGPVAVRHGAKAGTYAFDLPSSAAALITVW